MKSAYNTFSSLRQINPEKLLRIESFLNTKKEYIADLQCCYHDHYKSLDEFEFLPGHKDLILGIPSQIEQLYESKQVRGRKATISDDELKNNLTNNLLNYTEKIGLLVGDNAISHVNVHNFRRGTDSDSFLCKCLFICPICAKSFTVTHKKYWATSNVTAHFKEHYNSISEHENQHEDSELDD